MYFCTHGDSDFCEESSEQMEGLLRINFSVLPQSYFAEVKQPQASLSLTSVVLGWEYVSNKAYFECQNGFNYANTHNPLPGRQSKGKNGDREDYPCNLLTTGNVSHNLSGSNYRYIILNQACLFS